jgi:hypothetical protein
MLQRISSIKEGLAKIMKSSFGENSEFIFCFLFSLGTAIGLVLSVTCFLFEDAPLGFSCAGLVTTVICFGGFLYVYSKMD